jgi:endonuclease/exonuclease/phosphatase family metal-dependent hydrolase
MFKVATLNLWGYFDWGDRKDHILSLLEKQSPDFLALQEAQTNRAYSSWPQSDFIADRCDFKYRVFAPTYRRIGQIDPEGNATQDASFGLAFLSRHPVISSETYFLRQHPDHDEACSVLFVTVNIEAVETMFCNVHFGNSDVFSDLHLKELIELCGSRQVSPIIIGDFNIFGLDAYKADQLKGYSLSTDIDQYISMPKDNGTLDYIAVPTNEFLINDIYCSDIYVSDHRALFANLEYKESALG